MSKIIMLTGVILAVSCLSACSEKPRTAEWYEEHPEVWKREEEYKKIELRRQQDIARFNAEIFSRHMSRTNRK